MTDNPNENTDSSTPTGGGEIKVSRLQAIFEVVQFLVISIVIVVGIRYFVAQPFVVSGDSMVPTFHNGEYLIIDEISTYFQEFERGEVVVFKFPNDESKFFIKRVIGLPGETVNIKNKVVSIVLENGTEYILEEDYIQGETFKNVNMKLGPKEYFVMGDNRERSSDSRSWGPVKENEIIGRAFLRLLPLSEISLTPGHHSFNFDILNKLTN